MEKRSSVWIISLPVEKKCRPFLDNPNFELIRHDVVDPFKAEVDRIYNLACPASPVHYQHNPIKTVKTSVMGAINCLGLAKRVGARVLQASTSEVYGDPEVHPQPESYRRKCQSDWFTSLLRRGKRCAETLFFDYHVRIKWIFGSFVFSTPMVRGCCPMMDAWFRILSFKPQR